MCYQYCIKYECPNCGEESSPDRREDILCPPNSRCPLLESRLIPLRIAFQPGPLCVLCTAAEQRQQRANARTANQYHRHVHFPGERRRAGVVPGLARESSIRRQRAARRGRNRYNPARHRAAHDAYNLFPNDQDPLNLNGFNAYYPQQPGYAGPPPPTLPAQHAGYGYAEPLAPPPPPLSFFERLLHHRGIPPRRRLDPTTGYGYFDLNLSDSLLDDDILRDVDDIFGNAGYHERDEDVLVGMFGCLRFR